MSNMSHSNYNPSKEWILLPLLVVSGLAVAVLTFWQYDYSVSPPPYSITQPWFGWWFPFGWFFFIPIFFIILFAFRSFFWGGSWWGRGSYYDGRNHDPAHEILRERFARGEITKEQYEEMVRDLERSGRRGGGV